MDTCITYLYAIFLLLVITASLGRAQCPFAGALRFGQNAQHAEAVRKAELIAGNFVIQKGDPASKIWEIFAFDNATAQLYDRSVVLLEAQQFYVDQCRREQMVSGLNNGTTQCRSTSALLHSVEATVELEHRCKPRPQCDAGYKYVQVDGSCNNLRVPTRGSAFSPYSRLVAANFDDDIYAVRRCGRTRDELPSPRRIGNVALQHSVYDPMPLAVPNHGSLIFGQYITHDSGFKDIYQNYAGGNSLRCCSADNKRALPAALSYAHCMAMEVPADDPFYARFGGGCLDYIRSQPVFGNDCSLGAAQISSSVTQHLDQSNIYGSTAVALRLVRAFDGGQLLNSANGLFPRHPNCTGDACYFTGDVRGAFYPTLSLWHSVFIRFHNRLADELGRRNWHWCDERLFQETRRLLTAVYQSIVFNEWLPQWIGEPLAARRHLRSAAGEAHSGRYDERLDGSTMNEFSAGVFRLFHVNTPDAINMYDRQYLLKRTLPLNESIHGAGILETQYLGMMRGFFKDPIWMGGYPDNIRDTVFNNDNRNGIGLDLLAVDIMRGRDHGLDPYYVYLERSWQQASGRRRSVRDWHDVAGIWSAESMRVLRELFDSVHDVDLLVGLLLEQKRSSFVGPVGAYLMEEQFYRYKYGNRFFYTFAEGPHPFSAEQLRSIHGFGFADVLCWCSDIEAVPQRVFETLGPTNPLVECSGNVLDLDLWTEDL